MCNHLQMHSYEVYDHLTQHRTNFTCSGLADSMVAACLHQPLLSGGFITLGTAPQHPSGRKKSLGAIPPLCFSPQEKKKKSKQTKSTQKGKENTLKCRVDLLKIFWILQMKSCRCLHWVRQPDLEAFGNYVCGRADLLLPGEEFDLELPWEPWYCHGTGQLCWSLHKHLE